MFGPANLPYGVFSTAGLGPRVGVALGSHVVDAAPLADADGLDVANDFAQATLSAFMARGPQVWQATRRWLTERLGDDRGSGRDARHLVPADQVELHLPFDVADYVDFFSSEHHARNAGRILRPHDEPLQPNWKHLPVGYHGRSGTVVVSGTPIVRPCGQRIAPGEAAPSFGPSLRLDVEAEVGFVVGVPSDPGAPIPVDAFADHVFGVCLVNDWSARDLQAWESAPLGPFLGKSFATSISPWIVPLDALEAARIDPPVQDPQPLDYLRAGRPWGLDLAIEIEWNGTVVSRPSFRHMYWTPAQQLAHLTANGARVRTGDLYASGTVSGPERHQRGSFLELSWNGEQPVELADGAKRTYLEDGDVVVIRATAPGPEGSRIDLGEVSGAVLPALR